MSECNHIFDGTACRYHPEHNECSLCGHCPKWVFNTALVKKTSCIHPACFSVFNGKDGTNNHSGGTYQIWWKSTDSPTYCCKNHVTYFESVKANGDLTIASIIDWDKSGKINPETWYGSHNLIKPSSKVIKEKLPDYTDYSGTKDFLDASTIKNMANALNDASIMPFQPKTKYKFSIGIADVDKRKTVLDRIRNLVQIGAELVRQAGEDRMPDDEIIKDFDYALATLRESGK